jgi:hypothetical protein
MGWFEWLSGEPAPPATGSECQAVEELERRTCRRVRDGGVVHGGGNLWTGYRLEHGPDGR